MKSVQSGYVTGVVIHSPTRAVGKRSTAEDVIAIVTQVIWDNRLVLEVHLSPECILVIFQIRP
jgi:hypothetical protein